MENSENKAVSKISIESAWKKICVTVASDRYRYLMIACLTAGILSGCVTQAVYGNSSDWEGLPEKYCSGFWQPLLAVMPVTLCFLTAVFSLSFYRLTRLLICPAAVFRGMGLGALFCGALQCGSLREMCFAVLALQPYAAASCVIAVYAGEYALGLNDALLKDNDGMTGRLLIHCAKMAAFYMALSVLSCIVFAETCRLFGLYLI